MLTAKYNGTARGEGRVAVTVSLGYGPQAGWEVLSEGQVRLAIERLRAALKLAREYAAEHEGAEA